MEPTSGPFADLSGIQIPMATVACINSCLRLQHLVITRFFFLSLTFFPSVAGDIFDISIMAYAPTNYYIPTIDNSTLFFYPPQASGEATYYSCGPSGIPSSGYAPNPVYVRISQVIVN
jgi:hypothetical protein